MRSRKLVLPFAVCAAFACAPTSSAAPMVQLPVTRAQATPAVGLEQVDGGLGYYGRFSNALPSDPGYFPIGVWFESVVSQNDIDKDKGAGLNTYVVLTRDSKLPLLASNGMSLLAHHGDWQERANAPGAGAIAGWELRDEIDMELGPQLAYDELRRILVGLPSDGRLRYNNYGKGVMFWQSDAEAARLVNAQDVVSGDTYWFTDNNICSQEEGGALLNGGTRPLTQSKCHRAANYGATVTRMRGLVSPRGSKPVWAFVEVGHPFTDDAWPTIAPNEVQAAVWQSLIAGARGIIYFNHSFGGPYPTQHALREPEYAAIRSAVAATNRRIKTLAAVLNAPAVSSGWSQGAGTTAMVKWANGHFYVFAGSGGSAVNGRFSIPCVGNASANVLAERRTVPVRAGAFEDAFADGNAIHVYRIEGGSSCGLSTSVDGTTGGGAPGAAGSPARKARIGQVPPRVPARRRRLRITVNCTTTCTARSRLTTRRGARRILLAAATLKFEAGRHKLILRLSRRDWRRIAGGRAMRLRTVVIEPSGRVQRTQRLVARRR